MTVEAWFETQQVSDSELKLGYTAWDTTQTNSINDCVGGNCFFTIPDMPLDPYGGAYIAHIQIWDSDYMQVDGDEPSTWSIPLNSDCSIKFKLISYLINISILPASGRVSSRY